MSDGKYGEEGCISRRAALGALLAGGGVLGMASGMPAGTVRAAGAAGQGAASSAQAMMDALQRVLAAEEGMMLARESGMAAVNSAGVACADAVDAHTLGVFADPLRDQSQQLQQALEQAAQRGRALRLPPGEVVAGDVVLQTRAPVRIIGSVASRLTCRAGARHLLQVRGAPQVQLHGVHVDGRQQQPDDEAGLITLLDVADAQVAGCIIDGANGHGLRLERAGGVLAGNRIRNVAQSAVFALDCRSLQVTHNDIAECGNGGILVWQSAKRHDGALVAHNRIRRIRADAGGTGQNGNGVNVFRGAGVRVVENDIAECAYSAVRNNSGDDVLIARNLCRRLGEVAIFVEFSFVNAVVSGNLVDGAVSGISITNMKEGGRRAVVSGNIVRDLVPKRGLPGEEGYGIAAEADTTIIGNVVERAAICGIALGWGPYLRNVVASGNVVRACPVGVAVSVVKGVGRAGVVGNMFEQVKLAVAGFDHARRVTGELLGARRLPAHLLLSANSRG